MGNSAEIGPRTRLRPENSPKMGVKTAREPQIIGNWVKSGPKIANLGVNM